MKTFTLGGREVTEKAIDARLSSAAYVKDYRLEQLDHDSYRIMILPEPDKDTRGIKGSVLDALVDVYGLRANFEIDIITEDRELLPRVNNTSERIRCLYN